MMETYLITIGKDEYQVEANSVEEAQAKIKAAVPNTPVGAALDSAGYDKTKPITPSGPTDDQGLMLEQSRRHLEGIGDFGKGAVQSLANLGSGVMRPGEDMRDWLLRKLGMGELADKLGATRESAQGSIRSALAPSGDDPIMYSTGCAVGVAAPTILAPSGVIPQMAIGSVSAAAQSLGEGKGYVEAAKDARNSAAFPAVLHGAANAGPALRRGALSLFAHGVADKSDPRSIRTVMERLAKIQDELPVGTSPMIARKASNQIEDVAGPAVGKAYAPHLAEPSSYAPAEDFLSGIRDKGVETPGQYTYRNVRVYREGEVHPRASTEIVKEWQDPTVRDPQLWNAFNERMAELKAAEAARLKTNAPITVGDVLERRRAVSDITQRQKREAWAIGAPTKEMPPPVQAGKATQQALSKTLHGELPGTVAVPGAKEADDIFNAWMTVKEGEPGASHFLARWFASRSIGGVKGTLAGVVANQPMLWRSLGAAAQRRLAAALEAGDKKTFQQILRTTAALSNQSQPAQPSPGE